MSCVAKCVDTALAPSVLACPSCCRHRRRKGPKCGACKKVERFLLVETDAHTGARVVIGCPGVDEIGDIDNWPAPEGRPNSSVASSWTKLEPLSVPLFAQEGAAYDIAHTNMVELHRCTDYCLKPSRPARYRARSEQQVVDGSSRGERILSCRFDFGDEALGVPTRTHGKPVCMVPRLVSRPGRMSMYAPPQGHPRRHRGLRMVGKFWKGNTDTSVLLAPTPRTTLDGIHTGESFLGAML